MSFFLRNGKAMGFRVNTNTSSMHAQTTLKTVNRETEESFSKLSSGQRITKAADDAAGLAISEKLKAHVRSSQQANRNANDGISLVQTAEGGLNETSSLLSRMKELAIQAATDTLGDKERSLVQMEYEGLKSELERISKNTEFNGRKLLDGSGANLDFQVGVGAIGKEDYISYNSGALDSGMDSLGVGQARVATKADAQKSITLIEGAINKVSSHRSTLGSIQNRLLTSSNNLMLYNENMNAANSRIRDVDFAIETANLAKNSILNDAGSAVLTQANNDPKTALKLL